MKFQLAAFADEAGEALETQIAAMQRNGIQYLEIRGVDGQNVSELSAEQAREIRKKLESADLAVWSIGSPFGKIGIEDDFTPHLDAFRRGLEIAAILGAKHLRLFSFYVPAGRAEEFREEVFARMGQFLSAAEGSGVLLCHENEKGIFGDLAPRCAELHRQFPALKAVFDPANFVQCGQDTKAAWELLAPYVEYLHIKDALRDGTVVPAGKGEGDLPFLLSQYRGEVVTLEPHLSVFSGLEALERKDEESKISFCYSSAGEAFDAAAAALRQFL